MGVDIGVDFAQGGSKHRERMLELSYLVGNKGRHGTDPWPTET